MYVLGASCFCHVRNDLQLTAILDPKPTESCFSTKNCSRDVAVPSCILCMSHANLSKGKKAVFEIGQKDRWGSSLYLNLERISICCDIKGLLVIVPTRGIYRKVCVEVQGFSLTMVLEKKDLKYCMFLVNIVTNLFNRLLGVRSRLSLPATWQFKRAVFTKFVPCIDTVESDSLGMSLLNTQLRRRVQMSSI